MADDKKKRNSDRIRNLTSQAKIKEKDIVKPEEEIKPEVVNDDVPQIEESKDIESSPVPEAEKQPSVAKVEQPIKEDGIKNTSTVLNYSDFFTKREKETMQPCVIPEDIHSVLKTLALVYKVPVQHIVANMLSSVLKHYDKEVTKDKKKL